MKHLQTLLRFHPKLKLLRGFGIRKSGCGSAQMRIGAGARQLKPLKFK